MDRKNEDWSPPSDWGIDQRIIWDLGFFGHYMHIHQGGRGGKKHVISRLAKHEGSMTQRELQECFDLSSGSMSEVLAKLEAEGLVEKKVSETDARARTVSLTDEGWKAACEIEQRKRAFEHRALNTLNNEEKERLLAVLDELVSQWKEMDE